MSANVHQNPCVYSILNTYSDVCSIVCADNAGHVLLVNFLIGSVGLIYEYFICEYLNRSNDEKHSE